MSSTSDADFESTPPSPSSTQSSVDEDEVNCRVIPYWSKYRDILQTRGFRLDTFRDVKEFYHRYSEGQTRNPLLPNHVLSRSRMCGDDDDNLCPDAGLVCHGTALRITNDSQFKIIIILLSLTICFGGVELVMERRLWSKLFTSSVASLMSFVFFPLFQCETTQ